MKSNGDRLAEIYQEVNIELTKQIRKRKCFCGRRFNTPNCLLEHAEVCSAVSDAYLTEDPTSVGPAVELAGIHPADLPEVETWRGFCLDCDFSVELQDPQVEECVSCGGRFLSKPEGENWGNIAINNSGLFINANGDALPLGIIYMRHGVEFDEIEHD